MFFLMEQKDKEYLEKAQEITGVDYEIKNDMIEVQNLTIAIKDLICEYDRLQERFENYKEKQNETYDDYIVDRYIEEDKLKNFEF